MRCFYRLRACAPFEVCEKRLRLGAAKPQQSLLCRVAPLPVQEGRRASGTAPTLVLATTLDTTTLNLATTLATPSHPALPLCPSYGATTLLRCWMVSTDPPRLSGGEEPAESAAPAAPAGDVHVHVGECGVVQEGRADTACEARGIVWGVPATSRGSA